ncbi:MAG: preprotein translocase subunit SecG [Patescibacteria group bacterium]
MSNQVISIAQVVISVLVIILILLQERSSGAGGLFGGGTDHAYQTRRGVEKTLFVATIILVVAFTALALLNLIL